MKLPTSHCLTVLLLTPLGVGCGSSDDTGSGTPQLPQNVVDAVSTYAEIVHRSYSDSLATAESLHGALDAFVSAPGEETLAAARNAWLSAREPYLQTEVYRFYGGPIDDEDDGPEGLINAWPLDEGHIDYVADGGSFANIIGDESITIDMATLEAMNESPGEKDIATGYHAIEFLLWGQDDNPDGPGRRPFTDYVTDGSGTGGHQERRGQYLLTVSELLEQNLRQLVDAWAPSSPNNYRALFEAESPASALGKIMSGMIILSGFETGGERLQVALEEQSQEEEHSCFSDNTHRDMIQDIQGVQNVWLGSYGRIAGAGVRDVIAEGDPGLAERITERIQASLDLAHALQPPFDREIMAGNAAGNARVDALVRSLFDLKNELEEAFELYGLTRIPDPE